MASALQNLLRTLTWQDFPVRQTAPPPSGQRAPAARTTARFGYTHPSFNPVPGTSPPVFGMTDNVVMTIEFVRSESWVASWVSGRSVQFQNDLLRHEQGHYWVTALIARDLFIDVMQLKALTFSTVQAGVAALNTADQTYAGRIKAINTIYDRQNEADNGLNSTGQARWDGFFNTAFTQRRQPATQAPDGTFYKTQLLTVLRNAGHSV